MARVETGRLVGFVGLIGSGKGTAGEILVNRYGFTPEAFANPVKDAIAAIFGWQRSLLEGDTTQSRAFREEADGYWSLAMGRPYKPREALQTMGTEAGRNVFHPDLWTNSLGKRLDRTKDYVITDVRFPNEIRFIQSLGGDVIVVKRGEDPPHYKAAEELNTLTKWDGTIQQLGDHPDHYSEWAWIGYPTLSTVIRNDSNLGDLEVTICKTLGLQRKPV